MSKYRKFISAGVGVTFFFVGGTGVLFLFDFKNHFLLAVHAWLGLLMVIAATLHIIQHWKALRSHFRDPRVAALAIPILLLVGLFLFAPEEKEERINPKEMREQFNHRKASTRE